MTSATKKIIQEIRDLDKKREEILDKLNTLPGGYQELVLLNSLDDCESRVRFLNELLIEMEDKKMNIKIKYFADDMEPRRMYPLQWSYPVPPAGQSNRIYRRCR